ncbi:hypothetical protein JRO89_XS06G0158400 [Xanthoceras sorbifolium]|uniref:Uncharacterized protein n=1 Tax=Xanthoceras sorbifolium TaxID=99658 RepID=A0ABQ8HYJ1_9ROSI|nr:hypothetical protein JRO89_XS06G0158400 [Xanthoceras sorbifolium]
MTKESQSFPFSRTLFFLGSRRRTELETEARQPTTNLQGGASQTAMNKLFKAFTNEANNGKCVSASTLTGKYAAQQIRVSVHCRRLSKWMMRITVEVNASMVVATDMKSKAKPSVSILGSKRWKSSSSKDDVRMERNITTAVKEEDNEMTSEMLKNRKKRGVEEDWSTIFVISATGYGEGGSEDHGGD